LSSPREAAPVEGRASGAAMRKAPYWPLSAGALWQYSRIVDIGLNSILHRVLHIRLCCDPLMKSFGQSLGNAFGLLLTKVRSLAQLAGKFQRIERGGGHCRLSPLFRQKSPDEVHRCERSFCIRISRLRSQTLTFFRHIKVSLGTGIQAHCPSVLAQRLGAAQNRLI
jgi:hypothetical protein